nr:DUF421 domain-containing protein [Anaeromonas frigoriresistens]
MYIFSLNLTLKFRVIEKFFSPAPLPIIRNGEIIYKNLIKAKISLDFLLSELRVEKIDDIKKIAIALWEPGGRISVFLDSSYQSVTSQDMQILKPPFSLPSVVIREGTIDINALQDIDRTQEWLIDTLNRRYKTEIKDILLATIGSNYNIQIFLKKN